MDWKIDDTDRTSPLYLGEPADPTVFADSPNGVPGQPNLLAVDARRIVAGDRPAILFNPINGRPAYPLLRTHIGAAAAVHRPATPGARGSATTRSSPSVPRPTRAPAAGRPVPAGPHACAPSTSSRSASRSSARRRSPTPTARSSCSPTTRPPCSATRAKGDPLAIRANQGDCVAITLTNEIPDASAFDKLLQDQHAHPPRAVRRAGLRRRQRRLRLRALRPPLHGRATRS